MAVIEDNTTSTIRRDHASGHGEQDYQEGTMRRPVHVVCHHTEDMGAFSAS